MITDQPIDPTELMRGVSETCGAVVTFTGVIRACNNDRPVRGIHYECYRDMAELEMQRIIDDAKNRHAVDLIRAVHRVGDVAVGEVSLLVVVASPHREAAFDALRHVVDDVKRRVPIWKKELYADATSRWI